MKKYTLYIIIFTSLIFSQDYFELSINQTGESTLFIFDDSIMDLDIGDELGLFDSFGVINDNGELGEILVGAGIWDGTQLEIVAINSIDLSDFGGPILPGAVTGNSMILKVWDSSINYEYNANYYTSTGTGSFNGLFTVINAISPLSECDVVNCGCMDVEACNFDPLANLDDGSCDYPNEAFGECDCDGNIFDCSGVCGGSATIDLCGECDGPGAIYDCGCYDIPFGDCDCAGNIFDECGVCGGNNSSCSDCLGIPNGDAIIDNCGICAGNGLACDNPEAVVSFYDMEGVTLVNLDILLSEANEICFNNVILSSFGGNSLDVYVADCQYLSEGISQVAIYLKNTQPVSGFQFDIIGGTIIDSYGGAAEDAGFTISSGSQTVIGFSFTGASIQPSGDFYGCMNPLACNYNSNATVNDNSCEYPNEGFDCDGNCLDEDCTGECGGSAILDECGICEGEGPIFECSDGTLVCDESECDDNDGGGDGGGGGGLGGECEDGEVLDCFGNCSPSSWLGDGYCDESMTDFNCLALAYDMGDCEINFTDHVMPLINANCTGYCHTGSSAYDGGLNLESYTGLMNGGNSGPALIPYYPDYSLIIQKLNGDAPGSQMPLQGNPLPNNYINTIYYWIEQGAIQPDDNDENSENCTDEGTIEDCSGECVDQSLLGDGNCDDGGMGEANFNCAQFIFDNTDCPVGILEFGNYTFNNMDGSGTVELLMNCEFPVSNFIIEISGLDITGLYGGASESSNFNLSHTSSVITGINMGDSYIPSNSGLLTIINFSSIHPDAMEICFSNSIITTTAGYEYNAVLGDCIDVNLLGDYSVNPTEFSIDNIYPNPFNPLTTIAYSVSNNQNIEINIYDLNGKLIEKLINDFHGTGFYTVDWNAGSNPTGVYIVELKGDYDFVTKKITLIK